MKRISLFVLTLLAIVATTACSENVVDALNHTDRPETKGSKISLNAMFFSETRVTDRAFEEGDEIGLHILMPEHIWLDNAKYTYTDGAMVGQDENYWYSDENIQADVIAYYPYDPNGTYSEDGYTFTVNADQSTAGNYEASDLLIATTSAKPTSSAVPLYFKHVLSRVVVKIDNQLGEEIEAVYLSDVYGTANVDLKTSATTTSGSKGIIKAASVTIDGEQAWSLILVPQQDVAPKLMVTTATRQYTYVLPGAVSFSSGKVRNASITITKDSISTNFTSNIIDWVGSNDLQFNQTPGEDPEVESIKWTSVVAKKGLSDDWQLTIIDEYGLYTVTFLLHTGDELLRYIPSGVYMADASETYIDVANSNYNGKALTDATLVVIYDKDGYTYDLEFDVSIDDYVNLSGSYLGVVEGSPTPYDVVEASAVRGSAVGDLNYHTVDLILSDERVVSLELRTNGNNYLISGEYTDLWSSYISGTHPGYINCAYLDGSVVGWYYTKVSYDNGSYTITFRITEDRSSVIEGEYTGAIDGLVEPNIDDIGGAKYCEWEVISSHDVFASGVPMQKTASANLYAAYGVELLAYERFKIRSVERGWDVNFGATDVYNLYKNSWINVVKAEKVGVDSYTGEDIWTRLAGDDIYIIDGGIYDIYFYCDDGNSIYIVISVH